MLQNLRIQNFKGWKDTGRLQMPPILEATDSKWWGWKEALLESGITVNFLCPDNIKAKYKQKMEP